MNPTIHRDTCGTVAGYRAHQTRKETRCQPCLTAWRERCKQYAPPPVPTADEIAEEIEWLLTLNQGHGRILQAIGYQGRLPALEKRMRTNGYKHLAKWADHLQKEAA